MSRRSGAGQARLSGRLAGAWRAGPLAVRDFRLLSAGQLGSTVGDYCYAVALPWLVLSAHGGTVLLGTVLACYGVPRTVLIPFGGILTDRISPRAVMLGADAGRCVLVAILAVFAARGLASVAFLGPVAALIGAGEGLFLPASAAIMPSLLPPDELQAGNGISAALIQIGTLVGPVLGGILVTIPGPAAAFAVDSASFAISAGALAIMRGRRATSPVPGPGDAGQPEAEPAPAEGGQTSIWHFFLRARVLQAILVIAVLANFVISGTFEVALPALAHARFGAGGYGALIACFGAGSLVGTLTAAKVSLRRPALGASASYVAGSVAVAFLPFICGLPGAAGAALVFGATANFGNVIVFTLLQQWAPARLLGRVMSLLMLASLGAFPASVVLSGLIVRGIGPAPFFPAAGAVLAVAVAIAVTVRDFRRFGVREQAADRATAAA